MSGAERLARTAGVVALVFLAGLGLAADQGSEPVRQSYLQANLCGNACDNGGPVVISELARTVRLRNPYGVTLNELCEGQYDQLRAELPSYASRFDPTGTTCHNGQRYGNAILLRSASLDLVGVWELPNPAADEPRHLFCVSPEGDRQIVCVTHISNFDGNIGPQVATVANVLNGLPADRPVVLGGDFNTDPADPRMDPFFDCGRFREAGSLSCQDRDIHQPTFGPHKYDHVFLSAGDWSNVRAEAIDAVNHLSDHNALWVTATAARAPY